MRSEAGFSLLELLIAMSILSVGLMATLNMQSTALGADGLAQRTTAAAGVARAALEELLSRSDSAAIFTTASAGVFDLDPQTAANTLTVQGIVFNATLTVTPNATVDGVTVPGLTQMVLTVTGSDRTLTMTGYKKTQGPV
ncbi:MAG: type IV pilus modification PilV family protein [Nitrospirota bacterium]